MNCAIFITLWPRTGLRNKGIKRKNGEKDISPKKRVNSGTTGGTTVGKNPGKNGVKSARKLAPHTVSKPPPTPAATKSSGKSDIPSSNARSNAAVSPAVSPFVGMLPQPFPSLSKFRASPGIENDHAKVQGFSV